MFLLTLLVAGNETTRTLLSGTALVLHQHPDQRAALASDPSLVPGGVEECLRWVTPVHAFCRTATEDTVVGGRSIAAGDYLCMLYASGNRDERIFGEDAAQFDMRRPANPMHVAFGFGEHVCLGASLARLEARIFVEELLGRFPRYEVTGTVERVRSTTVAGDPVAPGGAGPGGLSARRLPARRPGAARRAATRPPSASALSRSRPPWRSERTNPFSPQHLDVHAHGGLGQTGRAAPARPPCSVRSPASAGGPGGWDRPPP